MMSRGHYSVTSTEQSYLSTKLKRITTTPPPVVTVISGRLQQHISRYENCLGWQASHHSTCRISYRPITWVLFLAKPKSKIVKDDKRLTIAHGKYHTYILRYLISLRTNFLYQVSRTSFSYEKLGPSAIGLKLVRVS